MNAIQRFIRSDDGTTAVEYAVMLAMIIMLCIVAVKFTGTATSSSFANTRDQISSSMSGS